MSKELGLVDVLGAEAVGVPGQRRFCIFTQSSRGSAILWMEKEQLNQLSLALDKALAQLTEGQILRTEAQVGGQPQQPGMPPSFPRAPEYDFREAQIGLTYNGQDDTFALTVAPVELFMEPGQEPQAIIREEDAISFEFSQEQAHVLSTSITALLVGGRPVCPLCGTPLDGGPHACVKQNGHYEIVQIADEDEDEEEE
jgi:uncharacterized repeat protein (TIGR03847 family)